MTRRSPTPSSIQGLLVVDKPLGWSSMEVVRRVRRAAGGVKTGHAGTLDPLATGIVICCLGKATKLVPRLMDLVKVYEAEVDLGAFTDTDDLEGPRTEVPVDEPPDEGAVREVLKTFLGPHVQRPPAHSAVHVDGRRAYELARRGERVELAERTVRIDSIEMLAYQWPRLGIRVICGKGTYIRSIARDLGPRLGTGGHLAALRRTAVGPYDLSMAVDAKRLEDPVGQGDLVVPPDG
jgi:tRNA pseudouridine55 synthase